MVELTDIWYKLYDKALNEGIQDFNKKQLKLYFYIDMFYSLEMGGLSGFLYNKIEEENKLDNYTLTLEYFGINELSSQLNLFIENFRKAYDGREETWDEFMDRTGVKDQIEELDNRILNIISEDRVNGWIKENYGELTKNLK